MTTEIAVTEPTRVVGELMMTADEARACVERIKAQAEDIAAQLLDLRERQGWKALGYTTWQDCVRDEFDHSPSYAHRLINAHIVNGILATMVPAKTLPMGNVPTLPERHARELVPLVKEPEALVAVAAKVIAEKGEGATAADFHDAVDEHYGREPSSPKATRQRSAVSSRAEAGDFVDDAPDPTASQETDADAPNARHYCHLCGDYYQGQRCTCVDVPDPEAAPLAPVPDVSEWATVERPPREIARPTADSPRASRIPPYVHPQPCTECGGDVLVESVQAERAIESPQAKRHADGTRVTLLCERCQLGDLYPPQPTGFEDTPATAESTVTDHPESGPARTGQEPVRGSLGGSANGAAGLGRRSAISTPAPSPRKGPDGAPLLAIQNDAGDLSRALLDKPIPAVAEALAENATPNQIAALVGILSARLGPEQRAAFERRQGASAESAAPVTLATVKAQILAHLTTDDVRALEWALPDLRKQIGARERAAVAV